VQHPDSSILDGGNRLRACEINGCKPRITRWDGKPGEELTFVISQNVKCRHLNESQRALIASKLASLRHGQRQTGESAGVPTQAEAAEMMQVSERIVRSARKVREEAPANVTHLVEVGRLTLNAAEALLPRLSSEDKQRIEGMSDDDVEVEVKRLSKVSDTSSPKKREATDSQTNEADAPPAPSTNTPDDDDDRPIGHDIVSRALERTEVKANTPGRQAFASAIERLPLSDAGWAFELMSFVEQEARETPE